MEDSSCDSTFAFTTLLFMVFKCRFVSCTEETKLLNWHNTVQGKGRTLIY